MVDNPPRSAPRAQHRRLAAEHGAGRRGSPARRSRPARPRWTRRALASLPPVVAHSPTATRSGRGPAMAGQRWAGTSAPRSATSKLRPRSRSATSATGRPWVSPGGVARMIEPRLRPRRAKRGPRRPIRRSVTPDARCSSATVELADRPAVHRSSAGPARACRGRRPRAPCPTPWPLRPRPRRRPRPPPRAAPRPSPPSSSGDGSGAGGYRRGGRRWRHRPWRGGHVVRRGPATPIPRLTAGNRPVRT